MGGLRYVVVSEGTRKTTCDCESSVVFPLNVFWLLSWNRGVSNFVYWKFHYIYCLVIGLFKVTGLFVPLHFRSRERKNHRENFRSRGTFIPWNIRSRGAKSPRTFVPWNFRSCRTFAPQERMFQELSFHGTFTPLEPSLHRQLSCPLTFVPVAYLRLLRRLVRAAVLWSNVN